MSCRATQAGTLRAARAAIAGNDPIAFKAHLAGACSCRVPGLACPPDPSIGDVIVYDSEVHAKKDEVNQDVKNLRLSLGECVDASGRGKLNVDEQHSIESFFADWFTFYTKPIPFWGASEEMAITLRYQQKAIAWRSILAAKCGANVLVGPAPELPPAGPPGPASLAADWIGMLKVGIPAAAVIAAAILAGPFVWEYATTRAASRSKKKRKSVTD